MALSDEKYILLTTFRRDGRPVSTPVWVVPLEADRVGFWTSSQSGKAKRLAHTSRVTVQPCDGQGKLRQGSAQIEATAEVVAGPELDRIREQIVAKYGFMTKFAKLAGTIVGTLKRNRMPYADRGVVITLPPGA